MKSSMVTSRRNAFMSKVRIVLTSVFTFVACIYSFGLIGFLMMNQPEFLSVKNDDESFRELQGKNIGMAAFNNNIKKKKYQNRQQQKDLLTAAIWPIASIMKHNDTGSDDDILETITHPANNETKMQVPKFWSLPIHHNKLMTREEAMKVGICAEPDNNGNFVRGDSCPLNNRTINVAISSYRDFQCRYTVESIFLTAKYPQRLRVTIVDQIIDGVDPPCNAPIEPCDAKPNQALCLYRNQIDVFTMNAQLGVGPVFARHIGNRMYRGEYYATQNDAHVTYVQDWDVDIISQLESTHNEMAVLSTYSTDIQNSIDNTTGKSKRKTRPIMCNTNYEGNNDARYLRHGSQPESRPTIHGTPQLQPWWAAGYSFSRGHFITNVPYDPYLPFIFQGEEMSIGLRGFTIGYDYYAPERSVCFHHYAIGDNKKERNKVRKFWENRRTYPNSHEMERKAMARCLGIIHMNPEVDTNVWDHTDETIYGVGGVRTPEQFYDIFGIDIVNKTVENNLCSFVQNGGKMHKEFVPHLRQETGMGIDYSNITYRFVDPTKRVKQRSSS